MVHEQPLCALSIEVQSVVVVEDVPLLTSKGGPIEHGDGETPQSEGTEFNTKNMMEAEDGAEEDEMVYDENRRRKTKRGPNASHDDEEEEDLYGQNEEETKS